jgi:tetratricopeptide (TPR) repeat protein
LYQQVLAIDPRYAPAWSGLAGNFTNEASLGLLPSEEAYRQAREAADKALALDPDYAPAHALLGSIAADQGDLAGAARLYERALALAPANLDVLQNAAFLLEFLGRMKEAIVLQEILAARDPVNMSTLFSLGFCYLQTGRPDDAIAKWRTVLSLAPGRGIAHYFIGVALLLKGQPEAALAEMQADNSEVWRMVGLPMAYHALRRKAESDTALAQLIAKYEKDYAYNVAYIYAFRGDADHAFEWLDQAVQHADPGLPEIPIDRLFDKQDARWLPFLRKIGKAPEQLDKIEFKVTLPDRGQLPDSR